MSRTLELFVVEIMSKIQLLIAFQFWLWTDLEVWNTVENYTYQHSNFNHELHMPKIKLLIAFQFWSEFAHVNISI